MQFIQLRVLHISLQVMANWVIQCADRYLGALYDYLHNRMYRFHVLQADETPVKVVRGKVILQPQGKEFFT